MYTTLFSFFLFFISYFRIFLQAYFPLPHTQKLQSHTFTQSHVLYNLLFVFFEYGIKFLDILIAFTFSYIIILFHFLFISFHSIWFQPIRLSQLLKLDSRLFPFISSSLTNWRRFFCSLFFCVFIVRLTKRSRCFTATILFRHTSNERAGTSSSGTRTQLIKERWPVSFFFVLLLNRSHHNELDSTTATRKRAGKKRFWPETCKSDGALLSRSVFSVSEQINSKVQKPNLNCNQTSHKR